MSSLHLETRFSSRYPCPPRRFSLTVSRPFIPSLRNPFPAPFLFFSLAVLEAAWLRLRPIVSLSFSPSIAVVSPPWQPRLVFLLRDWDHCSPYDVPRSRCTPGRIEIAATRRQVEPTTIPWQTPQRWSDSPHQIVKKEKKNHQKPIMGEFVEHRGCFFFFSSK